MNCRTSPASCYGPSAFSNGAGLCFSFQEDLARIRVSPNSCCVGVIQVLSPARLDQIGHQVANIVKELVLGVGRKRGESLLGLKLGLVLNPLSLLVYYGISLRHSSTSRHVVRTSIHSLG